MTATQLPEVGDQLKVIREVNGHQFTLNSWVKVYKSNAEFAYCEDQFGNQYGLTPEEYETLN